MNPMLEKLCQLGPEITMLVGACLCLAVGLHPSREVRKLARNVAAMALGVAGLLTVLQAIDSEQTWTIPIFTRLMVCVVGLLLLTFASTVPEKIRQLAGSGSKTSKKFNPTSAMRGEFFAFFLFSLTGLMLCGGANDLVWLFLALELTSLPTYIMVATSRDDLRANEAGIKYFFLGAMSAAIFLYGFTLIYGATGVTEFGAIAEFVATTGYTPLLTLGFILAIVGIGFKIAAFPMHFYTADVYEGAATPVSAFLAFVPKSAGFVSLILLLNILTRGHVQVDPETLRFTSPLPISLAGLLWGMAVVTMTVGNVMGLLQTNVKRILAYSSIAHSGYMLVGLLGISAGLAGQTMGNGAAAILFYLVAYALGNLGAFAVLGCLSRDGKEATDLKDLSGLSKRRPGLAAIMLLANLSLVGLPPMVGFIGKIYLFGSAMQYGYTGLVIIAVVNSAISAVYYLKIVGACYFGEADVENKTDIATCTPAIPVAMIAVALSLLLGLAGNQLAITTSQATTDPKLNQSLEQKILRLHERRQQRASEKADATILTLSEEKAI